MKKGTAIFGMLVLFAVGFGAGYLMRGVSVKGGAIEGGDAPRAADAPTKGKAGDRAQQPQEQAPFRSPSHRLLHIIARSCPAPRPGRARIDR